MKRIVVILVISLLIIGFSSALSAGTADDPLISLSYINDTFLPSLLKDIKSSAEGAFSPVAAAAQTRLDAVTDGYILTAPGYTFSSGYTPLYASAGAVLDIAPGTSAVVNGGTAVLTVQSGEVIDLSSGSIMQSGAVISGSIRCFATEQASAKLTVYSSVAALYVDGSYRFTQGSGSAPGILFTDIPSGHWATEYIYALAEKKLVNGTGNMSFEPETTMNRAMFVTVIGRLAGIDVSSYSSSSFSDVAINEWYGPYVAWAAENNIVTGNGNGTFSPEDPITREQMAVVMMRYANYSGITLNVKNESLVFADSSLIDDWALEAVTAAQRAGLITGKPGGLFDPLGTATRAEVCTVIYRFIS